MNVDHEADSLSDRIKPLGLLLDRLARTLEPPSFSSDERVYRFAKPALVHFCLLRGVRIVSALNAAVALSRLGYSQEIAVLLRTAIEYSTQIDFMLASRDAKGNLSGDAALFLRAYFADAHRTGDEQGKKKTKLAQQKVHEIIGARLDGATRPTGRKTAEKMMSNIYLIFSNYVHGRYPESMDLYGGQPGRFHVEGMRNTPKDKENILILDALINSASICLKGLVQGLDLKDIVASDRRLVDWYNNA